ncbi:glutathione S-transferase family protein [Erythrobacter sp.]|jgi:putative glutathione S-transferase|uniref:glutathione S-transferase family protein n=1 Tax=Erythrobacter sp. TaxID=1042 RepID=UPI002EBC759B|nr:glutathione S-transferase family protein [Erythrobacter sp.]
MGGYLKNGEWLAGDDGFADEDGSFHRTTSEFRDWITPDGSPGPSGQDAAKAQKDRFHLYVSYACPWAHRTLITRRLKGIEAFVPVSVTHWLMRERGWTFDEGPGVVSDPNENASTIHELYQIADPDVSGKATVPVLWDKKERRIVNNESSEIIRIFNTAFTDLGARDIDLYPETLRDEIDEVNERVYENVNNGVYKSGFATTQEAYEDAVEPLFDTLHWLEARLEGKDYLVGKQLTEADVRLLTTLLRFDAVYYGHFKCNRKRIADLPNLHRYMLDLAARDEIADTIHMDHAKRHYYQSHTSINPTQIVPVGPDLQFA